MTEILNRYCERVKKPDLFERINYDNAGRKIVVWRYRMAVNRKEIVPIEQCDNKAEYWEEALKYDRDRQTRIEIAKALYYLTHG